MSVVQFLWWRFERIVVLGLIGFHTESIRESVGLEKSWNDNGGKALFEASALFRSFRDRLERWKYRAEQFINQPCSTETKRII